MALYGAFDIKNLFSELATAREIKGNQKTPAQQRATAIENLQGVPVVPSTGPGAGISGGTGTIVKRSLRKVGDIFVTEILLDLTGLDSVATDGDIIGTGASAAYVDRIVAAENGTIFGGSLKCLEAPATGEVDIDVYSADEATGALNDAISGLSNTAKVVDAGADWTLGLEKMVSAIPGANQYLYLTVGTASTPAAGTYSAGKFLLTLFGY